MTPQEPESAGTSPFARNADEATKSRPRSIGQLLELMRREFPKISISKIRFLEAEGLLHPQRAPSGYRRYGADDVARLRYILQVQQDHYLPLKVIAEHLDLMDRGMRPPTLDDVTPAPPAAANAELAGSNAVRMSRAELLEASGLPEPALVELERVQAITPQRGTSYYSLDTLAVATAAKKLAEFGFDARHFRSIKMGADREVGLIEQALAPRVRKGGDHREVAAEVVSQVITAHAALVRLAFGH